MINYYNNIIEKIQRYRQVYADKYAKVSRHLLFFIFRNWKGPRYNFKRKGENVNISFALCGGVGDIVISAVYIQQFIKKLDCDYNINIFVYQPVEHIKELFFGYEKMLNIFNMSDLYKKPADIVIVFNIQLPEIMFFRLKYISSKSSFLLKYFTAISDFNKEHENIVSKSEIFKQQTLLNILGKNRITGMDVANAIGLTEESDFQIVLKPDSQDFLGKYGLKGKKYITFSYSVDINNKYKTSTRLWPVEYFNDLLSKIRRYYPDIKIVRLGTNSPSDISGVDLNLVDKTSFEELLVLLNNSTLHIDGECGMVHLRHFLSRKPSVVLFGPTSPTTKAYKENINIRSNICSCNNCEWLMGENWQKMCIKTGGPYSACMKAITPDYVFNNIKKVLES